MPAEHFSSQFLGPLPAVADATPRQAAAVVAVRNWLESCTLARSAGGQQLLAFRRRAQETCEALQVLYTIIQPIEPALATHFEVVANALLSEEINV